MEIAMVPPLVARMGNDIGELGMIVPAVDPDSPAACGSTAVSAALDFYAESRREALTRTIQVFSTTGTALLDTANDFSTTDAEIAATFETMMP